jgi:hypothetical protein
MPPGEGASPLRFFFMHIMKTAGTSFVGELRRQFPGAAMYPSRSVDWVDAADVEPYVSVPRLLALPAARRAEIRVYTGHFPFYVCELIDPGLITLTVLREPVERTVSLLRHLKQLDSGFHARTLEEIYDDDFAFKCYIANHQTKVFCLTADDEARSILRPIVVDDDRFRLAKENLASVDVVGVTEQYREFLEELRHRFGWWPNRVGDARYDIGGEKWDADAAFRRRIADENSYDVEFYEFALELIACRRPQSSDVTNRS